MTPCKLPIEKMIARVDALLPGTPAEELLMGRLLMAARHRLVEMAKAAPELNFIGIEVHSYNFV